MPVILSCLHWGSQAHGASEEGGGCSPGFHRRDFTSWHWEVDTCMAALLTCSWWQRVSLFLNGIVGKSRTSTEQLLVWQEKSWSGIVQDLGCWFELVFKKDSLILESFWAEALALQLLPCEIKEPNQHLGGLQSLFGWIPSFGSSS